MKAPWLCPICKERFTSCFKASVHLRNHQGVSTPPQYLMEGQPVNRSLDRTEESLRCET